MTNFMKEAFKLSSEKDFIQSILWACSNARFGVSIEKETAEENGNFDMAIEFYKREMELRKIEKECNDFAQKLSDKSGE